MITRKNGGALTELNGQKVLLLKGTPYEMGYQHGSLLKNDVGIMVDRVIERCRELAPVTFEEIWQKEKEYIRTVSWGNESLANERVIPLEKVQLSNIFPEFSCSGVALFGDATEKLSFGMKILDYNVVSAFQTCLVILSNRKPQHFTMRLSQNGGPYRRNKQIAVGEMEGSQVNVRVPMTFLLRIILEEAKLGAGIEYLETS